MKQYSIGLQTINTEELETDFGVVRTEDDAELVVLGASPLGNGYRIDVAIVTPMKPEGGEGASDPAEAAPDAARSDS